MSIDVVSSEDTWKVIRVRVGPYDNNVYVVKEERSGKAILVDAAFDPQEILSALGGFQLQAIFLTHAHPDHIQALEFLRRRTGCALGIHPEEPGAQELAPTIFIAEGYQFSLGSLTLRFLHTPGHTPGSVSIVLGSQICFCGDTLFPGGPGRTWTPEGFRDIIKSIREKLLTLPDDLLLLPGHGPGIKVRDSRAEYEALAAKGIPEGIWGEIRWDRPLDRSPSFRDGCT